MLKKVLKSIICVGLACWLAVAGVMFAFPVDDPPIITPLDIEADVRKPPK